MKSVLKFTEWQCASGKWYCGAIDWVGKEANQWYYAPRRLNMPLNDYVQLLLKYKAQITFNGDILIFRWEKQSDMRLFKNYINKQFRDKKVYVA